MKKKITKIALSSLSVFLFLFLISSCNKDDDSGFGNFDLVELDNTLSEAKSLLTTSEEGINAGDFQPGSKEILESIVNWVEKRKGTSKSQENINDAILKLQAGIETFKTSIVSTAFPWVQQEDKTMISISENVRSVISGEFTIQGEFYIVSLNERAVFNNLFALNGFPANGFTVRYSVDGSTRLLVGDGAWQDSEITAPGTFKAGEWINIAFTNTGSTQKLYVNGVELVSLDKNMILPDGSVSLAIGNSPVFSDRTSNLLTREFTIWNTVLDPATIQANVAAEFNGTEPNLEAYFPFGSDLGDSFTDITGNYTATLQGEVKWVAEPPVIVLDYTQIDAAIQEITEFRSTVVEEGEGDQDGDYPIGTISYIDELLGNANVVRADQQALQTALDDQTTLLNGEIARIKVFLVGNTDGILVDEDDPSHVGLRITPNYTPQGDYTYEVDFRLEDLVVTSNDRGEIDLFGSNVIGLRVNGYTELTEENVLNSGGGWNFTFTDGGFSGPLYDEGSVRSGVWHHAAIVHDDTAKTTKVFIDGVDVTTPTRDEEGNIVDPDPIGVPDIAAAAAEMWLGRVYVISDGAFKDFRIWDTVRTPDQLDADIDGSEPGLQLYFPLDRVKGASFSDETGNYNGEMRGIIWNN